MKSAANRSSARDRTSLSGVWFGADVNSPSFLSRLKNLSLEDRESFKRYDVCTNALSAVAYEGRKQLINEKSFRSFAAGYKLGKVALVMWYMDKLFDWKSQIAKDQEGVNLYKSLYLYTTCFQAEKFVIPANTYEVHGGRGVNLSMVPDASGKKLPWTRLIMKSSDFHAYDIMRLTPPDGPFPSVIRYHKVIYNGRYRVSSQPPQGALHHDFSITHSTFVVDYPLNHKYYLDADLHTHRQLRSLNMARDMLNCMRRPDVYIHLTKLPILETDHTWVALLVIARHFSTTDARYISKISPAIVGNELKLAFDIFAPFINRKFGIDIRCVCINQVPILHLDPPVKSDDGKDAALDEEDCPDDDYSLDSLQVKGPDGIQIHSNLLSRGDETIPEIFSDEEDEEEDDDEAENAEIDKDGLEKEDEDEEEEEKAPTPEPRWADMEEQFCAEEEVKKNDVYEDDPIIFSGEEQSILKLFTANNAVETFESKSSIDTRSERSEDSLKSSTTSDKGKKKNKKKNGKSKKKGKQKIKKDQVVKYVKKGKSTPQQSSYDWVQALTSEEQAMIGDVDLSLIDDPNAM